MRALSARGVQQPTVTVLGMTFKENVPDVRNSKAVDVVHALARAGATVQLHDPMAPPQEVSDEYGLALTALDKLRPADGIVLAVAHADYLGGGWPFLTKLLKGGRGIVFDVKSRLDRAQKPEGIDLWRL
jgi:UDP-N-acetyl-D-galactosamine dehydrogenase